MVLKFPGQPTEKDEDDLLRQVLVLNDDLGVLFTVVVPTLDSGITFRNADIQAKQKSNVVAVWPLLPQNLTLPPSLSPLIAYTTLGVILYPKHLKYLRTYVQVLYNDDRNAAMGRRLTFLRTIISSSGAAIASQRRKANFFTDVEVGCTKGFLRVQRDKDVGIVPMDSLREVLAAAFMSKSAVILGGSGLVPLHNGEIVPDAFVEDTRATEREWMTQETFLSSLGGSQPPDDPCGFDSRLAVHIPYVVLDRPPPRGGGSVRAIGSS